MKKASFCASLFLLAVGGSAIAATEIDLYVDRETRQIYAEPGPNRERLGTFVPKEHLPPHPPASAAAAPAPEPKPPPPVAGDPPRSEKKWSDKLSIRGYTQLRLDEPLDGEGYDLRAPGDRFIGDNQSLGIRRARVILSGDVTEHLYLYLQPDFASTPTGSSTGNFGQLRDVYADIYFGRDKEFRLRAGQSKMPYGWENLQSSQNRLTLDRADALNSALRDERDLGLVFYYTPKVAAERFRTLIKTGLKGSGDYGVLGAGIYNGQGANRVEANDSYHAIVHASYPFLLDGGQFVEFGVDAYRGHFRIGTASIDLPDGSTGAPTLDARRNGFLDQRVAAHFIIYPQPFGLQGEWTVGQGPELDYAAGVVNAKKSLSGGYLQAMFRAQTDSVGVLIPYAKWQTYDGASKFDNNAPKMEVDEVEVGLEWQFVPELELVMAYSHMDRTNVGAAPYDRVEGDLLRLQLQWNY